MDQNIIDHEVEYLENMGRPIWPGPVSLDPFLYPEPNADVPVLLIISRAVTPRHRVGEARSAGSSGDLSPRSHDQHWKFQWVVGKTKTGDFSVVRRIEIVRERNLMGYGDLDHLTNWGAITVAIAIVKDSVGESSVEDVPETVAGGEVKSEVGILLKVMSADERSQLEGISNATRVRRPDGNWNCQDWCKTVLESAVLKGLVTMEEVDRAVRLADAVQPMPVSPS